MQRKQRRLSSHEDWEAAFPLTLHNVTSLLHGAQQRAESSMSRDEYETESKLTQRLTSAFLRHD